MPQIPWGMVYVGIAAYAVFTSSKSTFFVLSFVASVFKIFYNFVLYPSFFTPIKHIPSPSKRSWLTGNTESYFVQTPFEDLRQWASSIPNEGLIRYYIVGNMERVLVTTPKALGELLVQKAYDFEKPELMRRQLQRVAGRYGVLLVEGAEHKKHRKNLLPAFSYRHIKNLYPIFWSKSIEMVKLIEKELESRGPDEDNVVQIRSWASRATLDIIGLAGMDRDFGSLADPQNGLAEQYHRVLRSPSFLEKILFMVGFVLGQPTLIHKLPSQRNRDIREGAEYIRDVAQQLIRERKDKIEKNSAASVSGVDIVSVALSSGTFTDEELIDQMMTFLAAGHETTSTALQWCIYAICKHPEVQGRLREEIRNNLPPISVENPEPLDAATLDSLPYLNAVCNEVLRFHPSVPLTFRVPSHDTTLVGIPVPKDTQLVLSPEVINHHKELWGEDAEEFNPDRWLGSGRANTGGAASNYALLTFLHGPRSCIGQGFAKAELACLVAAMVGRLQMELKDPGAKLEVKRSATVSPLDGVLAKVTPLEGW